MPRPALVPVPLFVALIGALASVAAPRAADAPPIDPAAVVQRACVGCHALETITGKGHSAQEWSDIIDRMTDRGVDASDAELAAIKAYLAKTLPEAPIAK